MNEDELIIFDPYGELKRLAEDIEKAQNEEDKRGRNNGLHILEKMPKDGTWDM